jgi:prolyl 4-hydroxylase
MGSMRFSFHVVGAQGTLVFIGCLGGRTVNQEALMITQSAAPHRKKEEMGLYAGHFDWSKPLLWTVPAVLSAKECQAIISQAEASTWLAATVNRLSGRVVDARIRDNDTAILKDDGSFIDLLYQRIVAHVPEKMSREEAGHGRVEVEVCGLFAPMRVYRYGVGQRFGLHQDQSYTREDGARSFLTLILYLNDEYTGGETDFPEQHQRIVPRQGTVLLFQHMLLHAGLPILSGVKYLLRTDVMYQSSRVKEAP